MRHSKPYRCKVSKNPCEAAGKIGLYETYNPDVHRARLAFRGAMAASRECLRDTETGLPKVLPGEQRLLVIMLRDFAFRMCAMEQDE